jgi:hypothetical protein
LPAAGISPRSEKDVATDPARAFRRRRERLPLLDDLSHEKMTRDEEQVGHRQANRVVVHQDQVRIVVARQPLAHRPERPVVDFLPKLSLLTLEFEVLATLDTAEVGDGSVVLIGFDPGSAAVRAKQVGGGPLLRPDSSSLRRALKDNGGFGEAEVQGRVGHLRQA